MNLSVSTASDVELSELKEVLRNDDSISADEPFQVLSEDDIEQIEEDEFIDRETMLLLYRGVGFTIEELSEVLDVTPSQVSTILSKYCIFKNMHKYLEASSKSFNQLDDDIFDEDE